MCIRDSIGILDFSSRHIFTKPAMMSFHAESAAIWWQHKKRLPGSSVCQFPIHSTFVHVNIMPLPFKGPGRAVMKFKGPGHAVMKTDTRQESTALTDEPLSLYHQYCKLKNIVTVRRYMSNLYGNGWVRSCGCHHPSITVSSSRTVHLMSFNRRRHQVVRIGAYS